MSTQCLGIIYQIYPLSFKDSNGDGFGDLQGIIHKLDYLKDLGITTIWLSPIFLSPMKDFGYDIADYYSIDPIFGTMKDFENLIQETHKREMKILLDYVPNHTSDNHPWFIESRSSTSNPKRDWYMWKKGKGKNIPPNNWISAFGGPSWTYDKTTDEWYLHDFLKEQPDLNWRNPEVKKEMFNVLDFYLQKGVDGFRLDALAFLYEDPKFHDDPKNIDYDPLKQIPWDCLKRKYDFNLPEVKTLIYEIVKYVSRYPNTILLTEIYDNLAKLKDMYFSIHKTTNIPFNFDLMFLEWNAQIFMRTIDAYDKAIGPDNIPNYVLSNHDQPRIASRVGTTKAKLLAFLQLTLRGIPIIYYGDELGMENAPISPSNMKDPLGIRVDRRFCRDPYRTPMQWNTVKYAGFSNYQPWLMVHNNYKMINVEEQIQDNSSFLYMYKSLLDYRKKSRILCNGTYQSLSLENKNIFAFMRKHNNEQCYVFLNFSDKKQHTPAPIKVGSVLFSTHTKNGGKKINSAFYLQPYEGVMIKN